MERHLTQQQLRSLVESRFDILRVKTIAPGVGREHVFKILHSSKMSFLWPTSLRLGYGLHMVLVARKRT